jgi:hypothetical protein
MTATKKLIGYVGTIYAWIHYWLMIWNYRNVTRVLDQIERGERPVCIADDRAFDIVMGLYSRQKGQSLIAPAMLLVLVFNFNPLTMQTEVVSCLEHQIRKYSCAWRAFRRIMVAYYDGLSCSSGCSDLQRNEFGRICSEIHKIT